MNQLLKAIDKNANCDKSDKSQAAAAMTRKHSADNQINEYQ